MTSVRPAIPADGPALRAIQRAAVPEPAPDLLDLALVKGGPRCPVAVDGDLVGYALALADGDTCYVAELAVAPDHRRQGHGTALLDALAAGPESELRLSVRADDEPARAFYRACGFEVVGPTDRFESGAGLVLAREA